MLAAAWMGIIYVRCRDWDNKGGSNLLQSSKTTHGCTLLGRAERTAAKHLGCAGDSTDPAVLSSKASICLRILSSPDVAEAHKSA